MAEPTAEQERDRARTVGVNSTIYAVERRGGHGSMPNYWRNPFYAILTRLFQRQDSLAARVAALQQERDEAKKALELAAPHIQNQAEQIRRLTAGMKDVVASEYLASIEAAERAIAAALSSVPGQPATEEKATIRLAVQTLQNACDAFAAQPYPYGSDLYVEVGKAISMLLATPDGYDPALDRPVRETGGTE